MNRDYHRARGDLITLVTHTLIAGLWIEYSMSSIHRDSDINTYLDTQTEE